MKTANLYLALYLMRQVFKSLILQVTSSQNCSHTNRSTRQKCVIEFKIHLSNYGCEGDIAILDNQQNPQSDSVIHIILLLYANITAIVQLGRTERNIYLTTHSTHLITDVWPSTYGKGPFK